MAWQSKKRHKREREEKKIKLDNCTISVFEYMAMCIVQEKKKTYGSDVK